MVQLSRSPGLAAALLTFRPPNRLGSADHTYSRLWCERQPLLTKVAFCQKFGLSRAPIRPKTHLQAIWQLAT
jgi:hypothetical protein